MVNHILVGLMWDFGQDRRSGRVGQELADEGRNTMRTTKMRADDDS